MSSLCSTSPVARASTVYAKPATTSLHGVSVMRQEAAVLSVRLAQTGSLWSDTHRTPPTPTATVTERNLPLSLSEDQLSGTVTKTPRTLSPNLDSHHDTRTNMALFRYLHLVSHLSESQPLILISHWSPLPQHFYSFPVEKNISCWTLLFLFYLRTKPSLSSNRSYVSIIILLMHKIHFYSPYPSLKNLLTTCCVRQTQESSSFYFHLLYNHLLILSRSYVSHSPARESWLLQCRRITGAYELLWYKTTSPL